jgi:hypothetical protein
VFNVCKQIAGNIENDCLVVVKVIAVVDTLHAKRIVIGVESKNSDVAFIFTGWEQIKSLDLNVEIN